MGGFDGSGAFGDLLGAWVSDILSKAFPNGGAVTCVIDCTTSSSADEQLPSNEALHEYSNSASYIMSNSFDRARSLSGV